MKFLLKLFSVSVQLYSHFGGCSLWCFTDSGAFWYRPREAANYWLSVSENIRTVCFYSFALNRNEVDEILDLASPLEPPESHEVESTSL